jgi:obg-like ATPase 1
VQPKANQPAYLEVCDIAGLVKGAAQGQGLGNAFLSHIAAVDGIFHVCRGFDDADVVHVEDRVDPVEGEPPARPPGPWAGVWAVG